MIEAIRNLLEGEVGRSFGAAQACVFAGGALVHESAHGGHGGLRTDARTLFDVSSLTKVVATTTLVYRMASRGELSFDDVVGRWFPEAASRDVPLRALLGHRSGLPAWAPLFVAPQGVLAAALGVAPEVPVGARRLYGDINFILLGAVLERIANRPLDRLFADEVAAPLGLRHTAFRRIPARMPLEGSRLAVAPTGDRRPRWPAPGQEGSHVAGPPVEDAGEVDDDNAWAMGGVAGHAGLFSTARDVARWAEALHAEREGAGVLGRAEVLAEMLGAAGGETLGFDRPSAAGSSAGGIVGRQGPLGAIGHLGFTGCSVWMDLDRRWSIVLLTNRVHPDRKNDSIRSLRPRFHDAVAGELLRGLQ